MRLIKLTIWLLAPFGMFILAFLFLLPPKQNSVIKTGSIGLVILDSVQLGIIDNDFMQDSILKVIRKNGLTGEIDSRHALNIEQAILEILSGKDIRRFSDFLFNVNSETYKPEYRKLQEISFDSLSEIVFGSHKTVQIVKRSFDGHISRSCYPENQNNYDLTIFQFENYKDRSLSLEASNLYLKSVESTLKEYRNSVDTWIVVCPTHQDVPQRFEMNNWLNKKKYLILNDDGTINFKMSRVFYAGSDEPGLRINREITYKQGIVVRDEYERVRKLVVADLRKLVIPGTDSRLFEKIFRGEQHYLNLQEGNYPDIVWEQGQASVEIIPEISSNCWHQVPAGYTLTKLDGWVLFYGPPFDHELRDMNRLKNLLTTDITPTILYLLHLPVAKDMQGRVLRPVMKSVQHQVMPVYIDSYSTKDPLVEQVLNK